MQALLGNVEQEQAGPASTAPSPADVLEVLNAASSLGFGIFSSIYGTVTAINPQTGELATASGMVPARDAGTITVDSPAYRGVPSARHSFQVREPGSGWISEEWGFAFMGIQQALPLILGGALLFVLVTRR